MPTTKQDIWKSEERHARQAAGSAKILAGDTSGIDPLALALMRAQVAQFGEVTA